MGYPSLEKYPFVPFGGRTKAGAEVKELFADIPSSVRRANQRVGYVRLVEPSLVSCHIVHKRFRVLAKMKHSSGCANSRSPCAK